MMGVCIPLGVCLLLDLKVLALGLRHGETSSSKAGGDEREAQYIQSLMFVWAVPHTYPLTDESQVSKPSPKDE